MTSVFGFARTPLTPQVHTYDCGLAALLCILRYFEYPLERSDLERKIKPTRNGVALTSLADIAMDFDVSAQVRRCTVKDVLGSQTPILLHWNQTHYVVYEGHRFGKVRINDPAHGRRTISQDEFIRSFSGSAIFFDPPFERARWRNVFRSQVGSLSRLWSLVSSESLHAIFGFLSGLICGLLFLLLLNGSAARGSSMSQFFWIFLVVILAGLLAVHVLNRRRLSERERRLRELADKSLDRGFSTVRHWSSQFVLLLSNTDLLFPAEKTRLLRWISAWVAIIGLMVFVPVHNSASYTAFALSFGIVIGAMLVTGWLKQAGMERNADDKVGIMLDAWIVDMVSDLTFLQKVARTPTHRDIILNSVLDRIYKRSRDNWVNLLLVLANFLAAAVLAGFAVFASGGIGSDIALLVAASGFAASALTHSFIRPSTIPSPMRQAVVKELEHGGNRNSRSEPSQIIECVETGTARLTFDQVCFGFQDASHTLLKDINMVIKPGQVILVLGEHGSGKSVLAQLAAGLLSTDEGSVSLVGTPLGTSSNRADLIYVNGGKSFRTGTIGSNLQPLQDQDGVDETWILERSALSQTVKNLRDGVSTRIGYNGCPLSEGEGDRLQVARVLAMRPSFAVLDETFRHFRAEDENRAVSGLRKRGIGTLVVSSQSRAPASYDQVYRLEGQQLAQIKNFKLGTRFADLTPHDFR